MLNICLFNPEIPQNTGNIARTCAVTGAHLHLVRPLGFDISESSVRRAGLDYWNDVRISIHSSIGDFLREHGRSEIYFFSRKGSRLFSDVHYTDADTYLVFGKESTGLSDDILSLYSGRVLRIPMKDSCFRRIWRGILWPTPPLNGTTKWATSAGASTAWRGRSPP